MDDHVAQHDGRNRRKASDQRNEAAIPEVRHKKCGKAERHERCQENDEKERQLATAKGSLIGNIDDDMAEEGCQQACVASRDADPAARPQSIVQQDRSDAAKRAPYPHDERMSIKPLGRIGLVHFIRS